MPIIELVLLVLNIKTSKMMVAQVAQQTDIKL